MPDRRTAAAGIALALLLSLLPAQGLGAATYEVGPRQPLSSIGEVPWEALDPGDTVRIHWRADPYREKWVIGRSGAPGSPITVRGVPGPAGQPPVITGDGATTRPALDYWNEDRSVLKVGGSSVPSDPMPSHIVIESLEVRSARPPYTFTDDGGNAGAYRENAAAIHVERGENVTIRNCVLHDSGNGLFVSSSDTNLSRDILVEGSYIHGNGIDGSIYHHNNYTAALGITFQYNRFGPLRAGCLGNNLKDRSAGLVVRYNWIEGGNRQLDLVDAEDSTLLRGDPRYGETHVYGNLLIETEGSGNRQVLHYGGDSGTLAAYRKGILYFFNNTIVSYRTDRTTLMRLSTNEERCDARNNLAWMAAAAGDSLALLDASGVLDWSHNWLEPGWVVSFGGFGGTLNDDGTTVEGGDPGFRDEAGRDFLIAAGSPCIDRGAALHPAVLPAHDLLLQYGKHRQAEDRPHDGSLDIGAYEFAPAPVADFAGDPRSGPAPLAVRFTDLSSNGPTGWAWDFEDDGAVDSGEQDPLHLYPASGLYTVRLAATNAGGSGEEAKRDYVCVEGGLPGPVRELRLGPDRSVLSWNAVPGAASYDVVKGDLMLLARGGGDFPSSVLECLVADDPATLASDPALPGRGAGFYYLARARTALCRIPDTYDGGGALQASSRDAGIGISPLACP